MKLCVLHIGKTGGTALKAVVAEHRRRTGDDGIETLNHRMTLERVCAERPDAGIAFFIRDPVARFVSGFNSRLRQGLPRHNSAWSKDEALAFGAFTDPNMLGEALSAPDEETRTMARFSLGAITHARRGLQHSLGSPRLLSACRHRIVFIGEQETFGADLRVFQNLAGIDPSINPPADDVGAHRTPPDMATTLSELARGNLRQWYRDDYAVHAWCREFKARLAADANRRAGNFPMRRGRIRGST